MAAMLSEQGSREETAQVGAVIATGCVHSGWESVLPALRQIGFDAVDEAGRQWHDSWFAAGGAKRDPSAQQALLDSAAAMLAAAPGTTRLLADSRSLWLLDVWANRFPNASFLLFYNSPASALAHALQAGEEAGAYLGHWQDANRALLGFQRRHRRRVLLLDAEAASRNPLALRELCLAHGCVLAEPAPVPAPPAPLQLERLIAEQVLAGAAASVAPLLAELEASARPLGAEVDDHAPTIEALLDDYHRRSREQQDLAHALATERAQRLELERLQAALSEEQRKLQARLEAEQQAHQALQAAQQDVTQENELLLLQLHQVQEELENIFLQKRALDDSQQQLEAQRQQLTERLGQAEQAQRKAQEQAAALQQQLEQRQQAHARLEASQRDLSEENELLLLQLHQVQEELENYFLKYQELLAQHTPEAKPATEAEAAGTPAQTADAEQETGQHRRLSVRERRRLRREAALIKGSDWFDAAWYLAEYQDVAKAGVDPAQHYLRFGAKEGRNPSPRFDTRFYLASYPDVALHDVNPLVHFIRFGRAEGRMPAARTGEI